MGVEVYDVVKDDNTVKVSSPTSAISVTRIKYKDVKKTGISLSNDFITYILLGHCDKGKDKIYVGKSINGMSDRPKSHDDKYNKWDECFVITDMRENYFFNDSVIKYFEHLLFTHVNETNRFDNLTITTETNTANEREILTCNETLTYILKILDILGLDLITKEKSTSEENKNNENTVVTNSNIRFYITRSVAGCPYNLNASLEVRDKKFVVLAGSLVSSSLKDNQVGRKVRNQRDEVSIVDNVLQEDISFDTASAASNFVVGNNTNGKTEWKTPSGTTLKQLYNL